MAEIMCELRKLEEGLEVRISMLKPDLAAYFQKDLERLRRLIAELRQWGE